MLAKRSEVLVVTMGDVSDGVSDIAPIWHHDGREVETAALQIAAAARGDGVSSPLFPFAIGFAMGADALASGTFDLEDPAETARLAYGDYMAALAGLDGWKPKASDIMAKRMRNDAADGAGIDLAGILESLGFVRAGSTS